MPICVRLTCVRVSLRAINSDIKILTCSFCCCFYYWGYYHYCDYFAGKWLLETLESKESVKSKGHFGLYNCLVLGHTMHNGVQQVYCNPFPVKPLYGSYRLDLVMIQPPGTDNGAFVVTRDSVWYSRVSLLFSASAQSDTGSTSFDCALSSKLETYYDHENSSYWYYCNFCHYC